jgi:hypothetical protein
MNWHSIFPYIDYVFSLRKLVYGDYSDRIYLFVILSKADTIETAWSSSCLGLLLELVVRVGWERNLTWFKFSHCKLSWQHSSSTAYGVCISKLIGYSTPCVS